jgi:hypothetical protein
LIAVKDWAKPPSDHVDPYHLGIRLLGCSRQEFSVDLRILRFHHSFQIGERWWFPFWFFFVVFGGGQSGLGSEFPIAASG